MYWEEVTELIKTHGKDTESKYPNQYNDSDDYITYDYEIVDYVTMDQTQSF